MKGLSLLKEDGFYLTGVTVFLSVTLINIVLLSLLLFTPPVVGVQYGPGEYQNYLLVLFELWLIVRIVFPSRQEQRSDCEIHESLHV